MYQTREEPEREREGERRTNLMLLDLSSLLSQASFTHEKHLEYITFRTRRKKNEEGREKEKNERKGERGNERKGERGNEREESLRMRKIPR